MKTDISRSTFDPAKHYAGVRAQQGRVLVDADINEQADIQDYRTRTADTDLIGACGVPLDGGGFRISPGGSPSTLACSSGRIYVDGILVENPFDLDTLEYSTNPDVLGQPEVGSGSVVVPASPGHGSPGIGRYAVYLDVWEREVTAVDQENLADPALLGVEPSTRVKVSWQVRFLPVQDATTCAQALTLIRGDTSTDGTLTVSTSTADASSDPCLGPSDAGYRGTENQLYRVEIHEGGTASSPSGATWKWSRENAWVLAEITDVSDQGSYSYDLEVSTTGPDDDRGIAMGDIVEVYSDRQVLHVEDSSTEWGLPGFLVKVTDVSGNTVTVDSGGVDLVGELEGNIRLRRWDGAGTWVSGAPSSLESLSTATEGPQELEYGVNVEFDAGATYRTGQYWLLAARTETGTVLTTAHYPRPDGPEHHYCVLAFADFDGVHWQVTDCREVFVPAAEAPILVKVQGDAQRGVPNDVLPVRLEVAVGRVANQPVTFLVTNGGGTLTSDAFGLVPLVNPVVTDADGKAGCYWRMGEGLRARPVQTVSATWGRQSLTFHAGYRDVCTMWVRKFRLQNGSTVLVDLINQNPTESMTGSPTSVGSAEVLASGAGIPAGGQSFVLEIWEDVDYPEGLVLRWDASSVVVYCEEADPATAISRVRGTLSFDTAPPNEPFGRAVVIRFTLAVGTNPPRGRYVFHLRPKVFGRHDTGVLSNPTVLVPAPYGVVTCYVP